jgi:hypothetical protein
MTTETTTTYIWQPQTVDLEPIILFRVIVVVTLEVDVVESWLGKKEKSKKPIF